MRRTLPVVAACAAFACVAASLFLPAAFGADNAPGARMDIGAIAVIDMDEVLVKYKKYQHENEAITARQDALTDEIKTAEGQLAELKQKRDAFAEGSTEWWNCDKEYQKAAAALASKTQQAQAEIDRRDNELFENVLNDIQAAMDAYCRENGIKLVLWRKKVKLDQPKVEDRARVFSQLNVMYADADLDISQHIADILNKAYDEKKPEKTIKPIDPGPRSPKR